MKESHRSTQIMPVAVLTGMLTGVDLLLKWAMTAWIGFESDRHSWWLAEDWLGFEYARNSGAAFGAFQGNPGILAAISVLVVIGFSTLIYHEVESRPTRIGCMGLLVGGAAGNLIERIRHGYVTDFIAVGPWPRFNLADSAISVAVVVFILAISFQPETRPDEDRLPRDDRGRDREIGHSE